MILHTGRQEIDQDIGLYILKSQKMFLKDKVEIISLSVLDHNIWYHITLPCSWVRHETPPLWSYRERPGTWDMTGVGRGAAEWVLGIQQSLVSWVSTLAVLTCRDHTDSYRHHATVSLQCNTVKPQYPSARIAIQKWSRAEGCVYISEDYWQVPWEQSAAHPWHMVQPGPWSHMVLHWHWGWQGQHAPQWPGSPCPDWLSQWPQQTVLVLQDAGGNRNISCHLRPEMVLSRGWWQLCQCPCLAQSLGQVWQLQGPLSWQDLHIKTFANLWQEAEEVNRVLLWHRRSRILLVKKCCGENVSIVRESPWDRSQDWTAWWCDCWIHGHSPSWHSSYRAPRLPLSPGATAKDPAIISERPDNSELQSVWGWHREPCEVTRAWYCQGPHHHACSSLQHLWRMSRQSRSLNYPILPSEIHSVTFSSSTSILGQCNNPWHHLNVN